MDDFIQLLVGGVLTGSIYALIALGFSLVYRVTGVINLAQGSFCVLSALTCHTAATWLGWPIWLAAPAAIAVTVAVGTLIGAATFVPGLSRLSNANMLMMTAGLLTMFEGGIVVLWGSQPYALTPFTGERPLDIHGILVPTQGLWVIGTTAAVILGLYLLLSRTSIGQALRACAENPTAARLMGISVPRMTLLSFALAALIGAVAGVVIAPAMTLQFDTGRLFTISGFIAVAIGGIASFPGSIVGGLLLGLVSHFATAYVSSLFSSAIALGILMIVLIWRPSGLIRGGTSRRQDVREEARIWKHATRLTPRATWIAGAAALSVALILPLILPDGAILGSFVVAGILFIALLGLDVLMGYAGQVSLGQAGFMAIGGYTAAWLSVEHDVAPLIGLAAGMALSLVCALVLSMVTLRLRGLYLALATLAFGLLVDSFVIGFSDITGGPSGLVGIPSFMIGGFEFDTPASMYYLVLGINGALLLLLAGAMRTGFGRALQAIRTDQMAASALGIDVVRCKLTAFAISAMLASLSGGLYAFHFHFLSPEMVGPTRSLELVAMLVIGGEGTLIGPLFGSILLTMLPAVFQPLASLKTFFTGALLVLCFLQLPQGLFGGIVEALTRLFRGIAPATLARKGEVQ